MVARGCNIMSTSAVHLHKQLLLHPQFPTAVQKGRATRKAALVCAVTCLHLGGPDCCSPTFLVTYLSCYSGTLHDEDRVLRSALMMMEANNLSPKMLDYAWGAAAQAKAASSSIINTSGSGAFGWLWTFSGVPSARFQHNMHNFPLGMAMPKADAGVWSATLPPSVNMTAPGPRARPAVQPASWAWTGEEAEACPPSVQTLIDPTYLLPAIAGALSSGAVHDVVMGMEGGALAYAVMATASKSQDVRRLGYQVLELALQHVEEVQEKKSGVTRDWTSLGVLLKSLRDSITQPLQRIPLPVASFVAESVAVVTKPSHALFSAVTRYLLSRPFLDHAEVRLFASLAPLPLPCATTSVSAA